MALSCIVCEI